MTYTPSEVISIIFADGTVVIDGDATNSMPLPVTPAGEHAVQWYGPYGYGEVEYDYDFATQVKPPNLQITDLAPYQLDVEMGQDYINARNNPVTYWCDTEGTIYEGKTYYEGEELVFDTPPLPTSPPTGFTDVQPLGAQSAYSYWQWSGTAWISAPFPISLNLAGAQDYLSKLVGANASVLINNQLSCYDAAQIAEAADPELLEPRYKATNLYPTIGDYRTAIDAQTTPLYADIAAATAVNQLYSFDPTVNEPAPYAP